jgi:hypothetical protein
MAMFRRVLTILGLLAVSLWGISPCFADITFTPSLEVREEYNDNIFLTPSDEQEDYITTVRPSFNLTIDTRPLTLNFDYELQFRFFAKNPKRNEIDLREIQRANLESTWSAYKDRVFLRVSDKYARVTIDERQAVALDNVFVNLTDSNILNVNPYVEYPLSSTLSAKVGYTYENIWYESDLADKSENHFANVDLTKKLTARITTTWSYLFQRHIATITEDYDRHKANLAVQYQVDPRLLLHGAVGNSWYAFEESGDSQALSWNAGLNYLVTESLSLETGYSVDTSDSVDRGVFERKNLYGNVYYNGNIDVDIGAFRRIDTFKTLQREDRATGGTIGATVPLTGRMSMRLTGNYTYYEFLPEEGVSTEVEKVNRYGATVSFAYDYKRLTMTAGYTHNKNDSDVDLNDYESNIVFLSAKVTL